MILTTAEIFYPLLHLSSAAFQDSEEISTSLPLVVELYSCLIIKICFCLFLVLYSNNKFIYSDR